MKKILGLAIPFAFQHVICCGAFLFFLVSSGYLLAFRQEADKKLYLIPGLIITGILIFFHYHYGRCCKMKGHKNILDHSILLLLYLLISFVIGILFMIYVFIPTWIPGYTGGPLLP